MLKELTKLSCSIFHKHLLPRVRKHIMFADSQVLFFHFLLLVIIDELERKLENLRHDRTLEHFETAINGLILELLFVALGRYADRLVSRLTHHHGRRWLIDAGLLPLDNFVLSLEVRRPTFDQVIDCLLLMAKSKFSWDLFWLEVLLLHCSPSCLKVLWAIKANVLSLFLIVSCFKLCDGVILLRQMPDVEWILARQLGEACQCLICVIVLHEADMVHLARVLKAVNSPFFSYLILVGTQSIEKREVVREVIWKTRLSLDTYQWLWALTRSQILQKLTPCLFKFFEVFLLLYVKFRFLRWPDFGAMGLWVRSTPVAHAFVQRRDEEFLSDDYSVLLQIVFLELL